MNRHHGSRARAPRSIVALATALGMFGAGALAFFALEPSAGAVTLGTSNLSSVSVDYGGSIDLTAVSSQPLLLAYAGENFGGLGVDVKIPKGTTVTIGPLTQSGTNQVAWVAYCGGLGCHPKTYVMNVVVGDAPPPPPSSSTPAPPDSSTPGSPGGGTTGSTPTGPATGSSTPGAPASGTGSSAIGSKPSSSANGGGGISIGPTEIHPSNDGNIPLGFGPPIDPNAPTPNIPNPIGSGVGVVPTGVVNTADAPSGSSSTQTLVELANTTPKPKSRPTSLAIVSIGLLAIVASVYAYRRLGEQAQHPAH